MFSASLSRLGSIWRRWRRPRPVVPIPVDFYTRKGCCLCDEALAGLSEAGRRYSIAINLIDIDESPELREKHGQCVPVVAVNGRIRFRGRVNRVLLERLLRAESKNQG